MRADMRPTFHFSTSRAFLISLERTPKQQSYLFYFRDASVDRNTYRFWSHTLLNNNGLGGMKVVGYYVSHLLHNHPQTSIDHIKIITEHVEVNSLQMQDAPNSFAVIAFHYCAISIGSQDTF
jgi:hypothetical protein